MEIALNSRLRRMWFLAAGFLLSGTFLAASTLQFLAAHFSTSAAHLPLAVRLAPGNAEYHEFLGNQLLERHNDVAGALQQYQLATVLNPHDGTYWLAVARARQILNDVAGQRYALERAIQADPTTPDLAWQAANFFLAQGDTDRALRQFEVVVENQPGMAYAAFALSSHVADLGTILHRIIPAQPSAYFTLIDFLTTQKNTAGAVQAWNELVHLNKKFDVRRALPYIDYLIAQHDVADANLAWQQTAQLCGLSAYLGTPENLVINPRFDDDILNGGFDWRYQRKANVEVALDAAEFRNGHRSLSVVFDGPSVEEAGISQYVPVQPNTIYEFSAYYKAQAMDGAGGPRLSVEDAYAGTNYFSSEDLRDADVWREVSGEFRSGADAQVVIIRILRMPAGSPIRGRLWLDDFRLTEKGEGR